MSEDILAYYNSISPDWKLPKDVSLLYPFDDPNTKQAMRAFYSKYYKSSKKRWMILGINPGRLGAGVTGVPFTDPKILEQELKIKNPFPKKHELSSIYVYELINSFGGPRKFYQSFFVSSVCPLGFTKNGINYNYYDDKELYNKVEKHIIKYIEKQLSLPIRTDVAFSWGKGKNYKFLKALNDHHQWFDHIIPQAHPRWVMQYRRKSKDEIMEQAVNQLIKKKA